jgi:hypothetical protein
MCVSIAARRFADLDKRVGSDSVCFLGVDPDVHDEGAAV